MVYRVYSEKRAAYSEAAAALCVDISTFLGIKGLDRLRIINRYDVEGIDEALLNACIPTVFSEPQVDNVYRELPEDDPGEAPAVIFAVEYLPGQFDQRADSAAQCISLVAMCDRPVVRSATVYMLYGSLSAHDIDAIKAYIINPVDSREASMDLPDTLAASYEEPDAPAVVRLSDTEPAALIKQYGLAMDEADVEFIKSYFASEGREPTITELRVIDTYWSDHCRHTTFNTRLEKLRFDDEKVERAYKRYLALRKKTDDKKPVCLMDMACIAAKALKRSGKLKALDESDEINACTVKVDVDVNGTTEPWLLFFKNETHNHPTEIEPFGGAATCIGGAIRDPLSGRSYVYHAMRVTGGADPLAPVEATIKGKLPQRRLLTTAAQGYSSYGNQIGLATGLVDEVYHDGYLAKHMEIGAVVGAAPARNVRREKTCEGDFVILLGGRTGRDGCGGATGSSKAHDKTSLTTCGAEVQKGNPPEERKLQRLFLDPEASVLIKCCNDFGAGGVSVAIGELADGLDIDLNAVPKKYDGLDATELAISESQERMAVVVSSADAPKFLELAHRENLEATVVARVNSSGRMVMRHNGARVVDLSRDFLNTNGAPKHMDAHIAAARAAKPAFSGGAACGVNWGNVNCGAGMGSANCSANVGNVMNFGAGIGNAAGICEANADGFDRMMRTLVSDINICSRRGLAERFDSTIGAGTVLMPFGGANMITPPQAMAAKFPVQNGETESCSVMAYGFDPELSEADPYAGAYCAVISSVAKLVATGASTRRCWLTFQEYFERLGSNPKRWGKPVAALLGAMDAQMGLEIASIGGKDSMSGSFEDISVPPTLVSFAVAAEKTGHIVSPEFKRKGSRIVLLAPDTDENGLPRCASVRKCMADIAKLTRRNKALAIWACDKGGIAEGIFKMCIGNGIGFEFDESFAKTHAYTELFERRYGSFILELKPDTELEGAVTLGYTLEASSIRFAESRVEIPELTELYENRLESVYHHKTKDVSPVGPLRYRRKTPLIRPNGRYVQPRVLIPVFPGTNCELDSARAMRRAGAEPDILVINNLTAKDIEESVAEFAKRLDNSQILFIPGGFSGGDEPEGSAKLIASFMRSGLAADAIETLLNKHDGLILGICNGFQALIKLGLLPFGKICTASSDSPTLTYNTIGLHRSRLVHTRVCSDLSPWMMYRRPGSVSLVPISHGEGRFVCNEVLLRQLIANGQIASQYCDAAGVPSMSTDVNPNGSVLAIEGITSPDGRIFGKMAHSERSGRGLYKNVPGRDESKIFDGAVDYFRL